MIYGIIILTSIIAIFLFFVWQIKVSYKYLKFDKITIDPDKKQVILNSQIIPFNSINYVSVKETIQPAATERYFTRYAHNHQISIIEFQLDNLTVVQCQLNSVGQVYKILKQLKPYVKILDNIDDFKPKFVDGPTIFGLILFILYVCYNLFLKK